MRILVLDDDDNRHAYFDKQFPNDDVNHVHTYSKCVATLLSDDKFDVVFLDHDLNDHGYKSLASDKDGYIQRSMTQFSRPYELDGRDVVEDMVQFLPAEKRPGQVIVHSWNPSGAQEMMKMLKDAGFNAIRWVFNPKDNLKANGTS